MRQVRFESLESRQLFAAGGTGLQAVYFNNQNFTGTQVSRLDPQVNFNFGTKGPASGISGDTFSIRWTGQIKPAFSEKYVFKTVSDDGVRLWINHKPVIANWGQVGLGTNTGKVDLVAGKKYDIQLEYREKTGSASVKLLWSSTSTPEALVPASRLFPVDQNLKSKIDHAVAFAQGALLQTLADLGGKTNKFPSITNDDGTWGYVDYHDWTSGFFAGSLWQMYNRTLSKSWRLSAASLTTPLAAGKAEPDDTGFRFSTAYQNLYNTMQVPADKQVLIDAAAAKIATFNSKVGMFKTQAYIAPKSKNSSANFMVLMDHTMDLELIYTAARYTNNQSWIDKANSHLSKLIQTMIRPDGGTYQLGYYNATTGAFVEGETKQGLDDQSTWARGQAWAIYSLTNAYAQTGRSDFLDAAKKVANFYVNHLPTDFVPNYDFNAPQNSSTPKDSSAAAVATSALLKLASLLAGTADGAKYKQVAEGAINSLCGSNYLAEGSTSHGILLHGAKWVAKGLKDNSLAYGDYYFLEALNRYATLTF
jgi:unsaturated chondroitin disaccharide hydrolase